MRKCMVREANCQVCVGLELRLVVGNAKEWTTFAEEILKTA